MVRGVPIRRQAMPRAGLAGALEYKSALSHKVPVTVFALRGKCSGNTIKSLLELISPFSGQRGIAYAIGHCFEPSAEILARQQQARLVVAIGYLFCDYGEQLPCGVRAACCVRVRNASACRRAGARTVAVSSSPTRNSSPMMSRYGWDG